MTPTIKPTGATLGAVVTDLDLSALDDAAWQAVERAFIEHAVLVFPAQHLAADAQVAFAERFGDIEYLRDDGTPIVSISNRADDGSVYQGDEHRARILRGNEGWHTDSSYMPLAAKASVLSAHVVPTEGGETEWADMRAAYEALDDDTRATIADLTAYHSLYHSQSKVGHVVEPGSGYGFHGDEPPLRPLVKVHPVTGRPSLFIGRHAYGVPGMDDAASEALLDRLVTFACQPPRTFGHRWQPGDVIVWDNRCVLHRARPYDRSQPRVMKHVRVAGDPASELALNTRRRSNVGVHQTAAGGGRG